MPTAATRSPLSSRPRRRSGRSPPDTSISIVRFSDQRHQKRPARLGWLCPAGSICWSLLADRDRSAFSPLAKIMVATSVCTGGRKCPPDTSISIVRFSDQRHQKRPARLGWLCPAGSICWSLLADRDRSAFSPLAKIMVATSVCTGGRKCPLDTSISIVRFSGQRHQKRPARLGWPFLVPLTGIEPVRILLRGILSPLCLPVPPQRHG